jgi:hypothetical protein
LGLGEFFLEQIKFYNLVNETVSLPVNFLVFPGVLETWWQGKTATMTLK